ncbi:MAG: hypothetical protein HDR88_12885 [Bacteroides sp.]|nr:hypothetical protein [Bacteroides sp.]
MQKILLTSILFTSCIGGAYGLSNDAIQYYKSDFRATTPAAPLGDWTCWGSGKTSQDIKIGNTDENLRDFFPIGAPAFIPVDFQNLGIVYCSNSSTEEGGAANEWLVSPAIDLSAAPDKMMLAFDVLAFGSDSEPKLEVYASKTGNSQDDFTSPALYIGRSSNSVKAPVVKRVYKAVSDISSPETYLAFVNKSRNAQILGFYNIELSEYILDVQNPVANHFPEATDVPINIEVGILTPEPCEGFTAVLSCRGEEQVYSTLKQIDTSYSLTQVNFANPIHLDYNESLTYTITITPHYEGATPAVYEYDMSCTQGYPATCVEEEGTATWCGWCIRGIAGIKQFSEEYGDRFIAIAVHGSSDPMYQENYMSHLGTDCGVTAFPMATFNRTVTGDPYNRETVESLLAQPVGYAVAIKKVEYNSDSDHRVSVTYAPKLAFDSNSADITAAVVVVEDGVTGNNTEWNQTNYYSGYNKEQVENTYGAGSWKYFRQYCELSSVIPYPLMSYDHVAMGIFNSFYGGGQGASLPATWQQDVEQEFTITFDMPLQKDGGTIGVQNWENTHIIVLLIDNKTGNVLNAAKMGAGNYDTAGINECSFGNSVAIDRVGNNLLVSLEGEGNLEIFNTYGYRLYSSQLFGDTSVDVSGFSGPVIVRVTRDNESYVKKMIF